MANIKLQKHQKDAKRRFNKSKSLIAFHGLGSGKTLTSINIGEEEPGDKLVLTPASLQHNYKKELHKFNIPSDKYHIVSYERFRKNPDKFLNKKPAMIIADEIHRAKDTDTMTGDSLRYARTKVKKFMGLTGSLAQNHPSEIGELVHTVSGKPILGRDEKEFNQNFIKEKIVKPNWIGRILGNKPGVIEEGKNLKKFKESVHPYVHTFAGDPEYKKHIPEVHELTKRIEMDDEQQKLYNYTFGKTPGWVKYKIKHNLPPNKRESANINAFLIGARQVGTSTKAFGGLHTSPKIHAIMHDIKQGMDTDKNFKGVVYSNFLESGLHPLSQKLKKLKIPYGSFTGEQSNEERNQMVHDYNKGKLKVLLLSPAGAEGLDLKGTKYSGIMDPSWNPEKENQFIGRAARFKSHESLPENERYVNVVRYLSSPKLGWIDRLKKRYINKDTHKVGVDEYIYNRAQEKSRLNKQFTDLLKEAN